MPSSGQCSAGMQIGGQNKGPHMFFRYGDLRHFFFVGSLQFISVYTRLWKADSESLQFLSRHDYMTKAGICHFQGIVFFVNEVESDDFGHTNCKLN